MKPTTTSACILFGLAISVGAVKADDKWDISKVDVSKLPPAVANKAVTYAKEIQPLFKAACFRCHGEDEAKGELRLDSRDMTLLGGENGKVVVPGDSKNSLLVAAAAQIDEEIAMPPKRGPGEPSNPRGPGAPDNRPSGSGGGNPPSGSRGGPEAPGGAGGSEKPGGRGFEPPPKPLTPAQVGLIRAWIDQGAK